MPPEPGNSDPARYERLIRQAYRKIQSLEADLAAADHQRRAPIAVVGLGCRFPGADGPDPFWQLLHAGVDATRDAPVDRWGPTPPRRGGFLADVRSFDPLFFGISAREARSLDPQQRLLLEVSSEALEHAGIAASSLLASPTGVFVGIMSGDYGALLLARDPAEYDAYQGTGTSASVASGRIAYTFGLQGPTLSVDTACSSSLVAVHQAIRSLRAGECDLALAGGVNVLLSARVFASYAGTTALAPDGRCKTFGARADGFGRGEGCGVVVLRRLSDALTRGERVLAVLRGSAINHDGRVSGLTVPNGPAQQDVQRAALRDAGLRPEDIGYIEAHGTGTSLGDPIEIGAIAGVHAGRTTPLWVGAVKTNLGHLEGAAGIASLIKTILSLEHAEIPASLHADPPSPHIDWPAALRVPTSSIPWTTPRIAGVSAFGISGTNAHVIVEQAPPPPPATPSGRTLHLLPISARTPATLHAALIRHRDHLAAHPDQDPADVCATASAGRSHFEHRLAVLGATTHDLRAGLDDALAGLDAPHVFTGDTRGRRGPAVVFLFAGQGGQYPAMARALDREYPVFRAAFDRCDELLTPLLGTSLRPLIYPPSDPTTQDPAGDPLGQTALTQPALFVIQYALARLWQSWGVEPEALMGHSAGEYVAACLAGVFSLEDGLRLIAARGRLMQDLPPGGCMAAVMAPADVVAPVIAASTGPLALAAINGPHNTVISGERRSVAAALAIFTAHGIETRALDISIASHCPLMEPMLPAFRRVAEQVTYHPPQRRLISNLSGAEAGPEIAGPDYWISHIRRPVQFAAGMATLAAQGIGAFIEIGPRATLLGLARPCLADEPAAAALWLPSLRRDRDDPSPILESLARLHVHGARIDWSAVTTRHQRRRLSLPTYPFARERHWIDVDDPGSTTPPEIHPLLGHAADSLALAPGELLFEGTPARATSLHDHRVHGQPLLPATAYLEMALAAAAHARPGTAWLARDVAFHRGLSLADPRTVQTLLRPDATGLQVTIASREPDATWLVHASGRLEPATSATAQATPETLAALRSACPHAVPTASLHAALHALGVDYGPAFRGLDHVHRGPDQALGTITLPPTTEPEADAYAWHPALLDAALQLSFAAAFDEPTTAAHPPAALLPAALESCQLPARAPGTALHAHARLRTTGEHGRVADVTLYDEHGHPIGALHGLYLRRAGPPAPAVRRDWLYEPTWHPRPLTPEQTLPSARSPAPPWLLLTADHDTPATAAELAATLTNRGASAITVAWQPGLDLDALLQTHAPRGVVHMLGPDADPAPADPAALARDTTRLGASLLALVQALARHTPATPLHIVTRGALSVRITPREPGTGPAQSLLWGMTRALDGEHPELAISRVDLDPRPRPGALARLADELLHGDHEPEVAHRHDERLVARLVRHPAPPPAARLTRPDVANPRLEIPDPGSLDNLTFKPAPLPPPGPGEVQLEIHATGLNFRDVLAALGEYPGDPGPLGHECSGQISALGPGVDDLAVGDRVCALAHGSFARAITLDRHLVARIGSIPPAAAATLPIAFLTAAYGLHALAGLRPGQRVLIHAASGGVGQAAIQLAHRAGAEVFATASPGKWSVVRALGVSHLHDSRSLEFTAEILHRTAGEGVHVVLNSLTGPGFVAASLAALAPGGHFIEISKRNTLSAAEVQRLRPDVSYKTLDLGEVRSAEPARLGALLTAVIADVEAGQLHPLPFTTYDITDAPAAFRSMQQGQHTGKLVLIQPRPTPANLPADATYLVTGGLGGLGLAVADWLHARGARHMILLGRSAPTPAAAATLADLRSRGAAVTVAAADIADPAALAEILAEIPADRPLRGVMHCAGVLADGLAIHQTWDRFTTVLAPKVDGAWNLHLATLACPLDFLVAFSSASALLGTPGQANHAAANAFLDQLAHHRRALGLPGLSVGWGAWADVGAAAGLADAQLARKGLGLMPPRDALAALAALMAADAPHVGVLAIDWPTFLAGSPRRTHFFRELRATTPAPTKSGPAAPEPLQARLAACAPEDVPGVVADYLAHRIARVLGIRRDQLAPDLPLGQLGLDSLMAVELKHHLKRDTAVDVPLSDLLDDMSTTRLAALLTARTRPAVDPAPPTWIDTEL